MTNSSISWSVGIGIVAIVGIFSMQTYWLIDAFKMGDAEFSQSVQIALLNTARRIASHSDASEMPIDNPVQQVYSDYYVVNTNTYLDAKVLEVYLISEFEKMGLHHDFEYGIYDCHTDQMIYGALINSEGETATQPDYQPLPKMESMVYYFGVRFPHKNRVIITNLSVWLAFMAISILVMLFFGYAIIMLMRQKRFSEQQKDFINNMTHEFKTPMSSIKLAADFLSKQKDIIQNDRYKKYLDIILTQNHRLNSQVENVLQISKAEKGSIEIERKTILLNNLVNKIAKETQTNNPASDITLSMPEKESKITADEMHLTNIIYSIIDNAIKYSASPAKISIVLTAEKQHHLLSISDKGIGIPEEQQKKVFQKFYRVPTGNVHNVKGFGLGLYYADIICKKHGWLLSLSSKPNQGTTIIIKMPKLSA